MIISDFKIRDFLKNHFTTMLSFAIVGGATLIVYLSIFALFTRYFQFSFYIAISIAYVVAVLFHFFSSRGLVFKARHQSIRLQSLKYLMVLLVNYLITLFVMYCAVDLLGLSANFGLIMSTGVTMLSNYFVFKYWTFSTKTLKMMRPN